MVSCQGGRDFCRCATSPLRARPVSWRRRSERLDFQSRMLCFAIECLHSLDIAVSVSAFLFWILVVRLLPLSALLISLMVSTVRADVRADVRALFDRDMSKIDYAEVMVEVERIINPRVEAEAILAEINRMVSQIATAIPSSAPEWDKIGAIQQYIYEPGYWNDGKAFSYDHDDPWGRNFNNRMLSNYLTDRRGNCITMPFLFIAIGQRMGLDVRPSTAPLHVFVRFTDANGDSHNLEATSGAGKARDQHYRNLYPITDLAVQNRVYLATLSQREAVAVIAVLILEHLIHDGRYYDAMAVADILLKNYPTYAYAMAKKGTAAYHLLKANFFDHYKTVEEVPEDKRPMLAYLQRINQHTFDTVSYTHLTLPTKRIV